MRKYDDKQAVHDLIVGVVLLILGIGMVDALLSGAIH